MNISKKKCKILLICLTLISLIFIVFMCYIGYGMIKNKQDIESNRDVIIELYLEQGGQLPKDELEKRNKKKEIDNDLII